VIIPAQPGWAVEFTEPGSTPGAYRVVGRYVIHAWMQPEPEKYNRLLPVILRPRKSPVPEPVSFNEMHKPNVEIVWVGEEGG